MMCFYAQINLYFLRGTIMNEQTNFTELQQKAIAISNEVKKVIIANCNSKLKQN